MGRVSLLLEYIDMFFLKQEKRNVICKSYAVTYGWCYYNIRVIVQYDSNPNSTVIEWIKDSTLFLCGNQTTLPDPGDIVWLPRRNRVNTFIRSITEPLGLLSN